MKGKLVYKGCLEKGHSFVFDAMPYRKITLVSIKSKTPQ
jgi:hypothetical protein